MSKNLNRHFSKDIYKWHISTWKKTNCGKFLKIWEYQDNLTCLLRNLYSGQEATVRTGHRTDWLQIRKGVHQACILSLCLFNLHAEYIMQNARQVKHKLESRLDGDCSHEIQRCLLFGRKAMTNLDRILKSRDITLPTKVHLVKAMVF